MVKAWHYDHKVSSASVPAGGVLFRLTTPEHCDVKQLFSGRGATRNAGGGRFHCAHQATTYCSDHALVSISEILFHMYRTTLTEMLSKVEPNNLSYVVRDLVLVAVELKSPIDKLVYLDSVDFRFTHGDHFGGTMAVHPDAVYTPFQDLSNKVRTGSTGIIYPSARNAEGACLALFSDQSSNIEAAKVHKLTIKLQLISEDFGSRTKPDVPRPYEHKLHATTGFFEFSTHPRHLQALSKARARGLLKDIPERAYLQFTRAVSGSGRRSTSIVGVLR